MHKIIPVIACLFATACGGYTQLRTVKPNYIFNSTGPVDIGDEQSESDSPFYEFYSAYVVSRCRAVALPAFVEVKHFGNAANTCEKVNTQSAQQSTTQVAQQFTRSGFRLSDSVCSEYFRRLGNQDQDLDFYSESTNLLNGLATGVMGLTDTPAETISIVGTTFTALAAGLESFDSVYHFAPDLNEVESMVTRARLEYEETLFATQSSAPQDYYSAARAIETYQQMCQTSHIRALVNQAINAAQLEAPVSTSRERFFNSALTNQQIAEVSAYFGGNPLSETSVIWLTKFARGGIVDDNEIARFDAMMAAAQLTTIDRAQTPTRPWLDDFRGWLDQLRTNHPDTYAELITAANNLPLSELPADGAGDAELVAAATAPAATSTGSVTVGASRVVSDD